MLSDLQLRQSSTIRTIELFKWNDADSWRYFQHHHANSGQLTSARRARRQGYTYTIETGTKTTTKGGVAVQCWLKSRFSQCELRASALWKCW
jgi:hypothetical protein